MFRVVFIIFSLLILSSCSNDNQTIEDHSIPEKDVSNERTEDYNQYRNVYFGDTHIHTTYSFDAYLLGNMNTPDEAYLYAKREDMKNSFGINMTIREPLDFYAAVSYTHLTLPTTPYV